MSCPEEDEVAADRRASSATRTGLIGFINHPQRGPAFPQLAQGPDTVEVFSLPG